MSEHVPMNKLIVGKKYNVSKGKDVTLEAIGRGCGTVCVRWETGELQLVRGDILNEIEIDKEWSLSGLFADAPSLAEEIRIDRFGNLYWCDEGKVAWTKGLSSNYSAIRSDKIIATRKSLNP